MRTEQYLLDRFWFSGGLDGHNLGLGELVGIVLSLNVTLHKLLELRHSCLLPILSRRLGKTLKPLLLINLLYLDIFLTQYLITTRNRLARLHRPITQHLGKGIVILIHHLGRSADPFVHYMLRPLSVLICICWCPILIRL